MSQNALKIILWSSCLSYTSNVQSQNVLDSLINKNRLEFRIDKNELSGPAINVLKQEFKNSQFVLIGENHNTAEIPIFTEKLFEILHNEYGYNYLALEQDPITMSYANSLKKNTGNLQLQNLVKRHPNSFTFCGDQEIDMIDFVRLKTNVENPVWGCDQAFSISSAVETLRKFKTNKVIDSLYHIALKKDTTRFSNEHLIASPDTRVYLQLLQAEFQDVKNESVQFIISSLLKSNSIYGKFMQGRRYQSRFEREQYMKERFTIEYNKARRSATYPKVILKFGNAHLIYGFNEGSNVISLGTFVSELATFNNAKCISLNTLILRKDSSTLDLSIYPSAKYLEYFTRNCDTARSHLIDLRPLRPFFYKGALNKEVSQDTRRKFEELIFGFDFLVFIGNGRIADFSYSSK